MKRILLFVVLIISTSALAQTLHLYGGSNQDVYLGCLNCSDYDRNSIWNTYGKYGNYYSSNSSIWNEYSTYGSPYSDYSPFNQYARNPPIVVDEEGNFYGYFTINSYNDKQADFGLARTIYKYYQEIRKDVKEWYNKIFE